MLIPLNLKRNKSVAISIVKLENGYYSIKPCNVVNGFGMDAIPSFQINCPQHETPIGPIEAVPVYDFDESFNFKGKDMYKGIQYVLNKLETEYTF